MQNKAIEVAGTTNNNKEEELFNTHKELCEALNMDEAPKEKSWQSYRSISYNYMLNVSFERIYWLFLCFLHSIYFIKKKGKSNPLAVLLNFCCLSSIPDENCGRSKFRFGRELCVSYAIIAYLSYFVSCLTFCASFVRD